MKSSYKNAIGAALCLAVVCTLLLRPGGRNHPSRLSHMRESRASPPASGFGHARLIRASFEQDGVDTTGAPAITYFNVAPVSTLPGQAAIATVLLSNATAASINNLEASCSNSACGGTMLFYPESMTNYVLQATGPGGNLNVSQEVEVGQYQPNPPPQPAGLSVTWGGACWLKGYPKAICNGACQGMSFSVTIPNPPSQLPLEATLYLGSTICNPSSQDNLNDLGTPTGSGGWIFWFIHHPNRKNTSAIWTIGNQSSGCVSYAEAPDCQ